MAIIFHLDLDAFFISVERILNPQLEGKPVIVGGDPTGRGVVAACSYEARAFGLHSAMPIKQAYKLCPQGLYIHGHHEEYSRFSKLVFEFLQQHSPAIEQASVDEFYMDFTGCGKEYRHFIELASMLQRTIYEQYMLPCSIGIASNKTMAKIATDFNKPLGITYVLPGQERDFLSPLDISRIPGIGKVSEGKLKSRGIRKIGDILKIPIDYFSTSMGKSGVDIWKKANGEGSVYICRPHEQKSISKETTFHDDILDINQLKEILFALTGKVSHTLREHNFMAGTINLKLRYTDFITLTRSKSIDFTDDDAIIYKTVVELLEKSFTRRVAVRLIGVGLSNFTHSAGQMGLFDQDLQKKKDALKAINKIRAKYGYSKIKMGEF